MYLKRFLFALLACAQLGAAPNKPKLVLAVVIDQFRYDYLTKFKSDYKGGLGRLLDHGAVFTNANYEHFPTVTAVGHSTFLTGAIPSISGIVANEWIDRELGKQIFSVTDTTTKMVGASGEGGSPRRLQVSTVGDELKMSTRACMDATGDRANFVEAGCPKVIGISIKDRSAILPAGHMANAAYWFDPASGKFVTSTYYRSNLPDWAAKFDSGNAIDQYLGKTWLPFDNPKAKAYRTVGAEKIKKNYDDLERTPYGNEMTEKFAEAAVEGERLGGRGVTDILAVSFSSNDRIGHLLGPDRTEIRDISIQTDRILGELFKFLDGKLGTGSYVVVLTSDHGITPTPEVMRERNMPGGRIPEAKLRSAILDSLNEKYGKENWLLGAPKFSAYLDRKIIHDRKLSEAEVQKTAAEALRRVEHVARVYTASELMAGNSGTDPVDRRVRNGFHAQRGGDLFIVPEPYWILGSESATGTDHGTPYNYDTHVPVIFMGPGIRPGIYNEAIKPNDIAPTLATMLSVEIPSGSVGRVLGEILTTAP